MVFVLSYYLILMLRQLAPTNLCITVRTLPLLSECSHNSKTTMESPEK